MLDVVNINPLLAVQVTQRGQAMLDVIDGMPPRNKHMLHVLDGPQQPEHPQVGCKWSNTHNTSLKFKKHPQDVNCTLQSMGYELSPKQLDEPGVGSEVQA